MSTTGLEVFDRTIHSTNIWLKEIGEKIGPDRHVAWKVLSTVLHKLRDRLPVEVSAHLGAQLPLLIRGAYYDLYQPHRQPVDIDKADEFVEDVQHWLADSRGVDAKEAIAVVFGVLDRHIAESEITKVRQALPKSIRSLWPVPVDHAHA